MAIKIEKGVPVPIRSRGRPSKYPFQEMELGDSFYAPGVERTSLYTLSRRFLPKRYTVEQDPGGCRCWRIK